MKSTGIALSTPSMKTGGPQSPETLRTAYDLSAVQAELARYRDLHGPAMNLFHDIRNLAASYAAVMGVVRQVDSLLSCCRPDGPSRGIRERDSDPRGHLDRGHQHHHEAAHCSATGLVLHTHHWTSLERAWARYIAEDDEINRELRDLDSQRK
jgi:hypothetical protein